MSPPRHEFTAEETAGLLGELDARLRARGVGAAIFVVGGAAMAAHTRRERLTADVDALTQDAVVIEEARALARERGLPTNWLNPNANMWMPPLPAGVLDRPAEPGLRVTYADDGFLFATKLIAQRAKDADDILALAARLGLETASPEQLEAHIRSYYTDTDMLEFIVSGHDVDREIQLLAQDASRMLHRSVATADPSPTYGADAELGAGEERLRRSTEFDRKTPPNTHGGPGWRPSTDR